MENCSIKNLTLAMHVYKVIVSDKILGTVLGVLDCSFGLDSWDVSRGKGIIRLVAKRKLSSRKFNMQIDFGIFFYNDVLVHVMMYSPMVIVSRSNCTPTFTTFLPSLW